MKRLDITKFYDSKAQKNVGCDVLGNDKMKVQGIIAIPSNILSNVLKILSTILIIVIAACSGGNSGDNADPVVVEQPIAYIKRTLTDAEGDILTNDLSDPAQFRPGAVLYLKDNASPGASSKDISSAAFSDPSFLNEEGALLYDVKDLHVSFDGRKLLFSMRAPEIDNADEEDQPKWNIWEYDIDRSALKRMIDSNISAENGHDISPAYLPDNRIVFSSTRQRRSKAILLDEADQKKQFSALDENRNTEAFVLHTMNAESGENIQQLTFNQSHDLYPLVMASGKILFSRWDNAGQTRANGYNLYQINPDGTGLSYMYGRHSHDSGEPGIQVQFAFPQQLENGNIAVQIREFENDNFSSQPTEIDISTFIEHQVTTAGSVLDTNLEAGGQVAIIKGLNTSGRQSLKGSYSAFFPFNDGSDRYLVSWSVCRIQLIDHDKKKEGMQTGNAEFCTAEKLDSDQYEPAEPLYGLWIYDTTTDTQLPIDVSKSGFIFDEAVIIKERPIPDTYVQDTAAINASLASAEKGAIHIRSVYDFDGVDQSPSGIIDLLQTTPEQRPQRFIRIEKPASIPDDDVRNISNTAYGRSRAQLMREVLGYAPIEPDGSVNVAIPANVPFAISVLNAEGQRTSQRHQNWLQLAPGETIECIGCHTANSITPHGRFDAQPAPVNLGAPTTGAPFPHSNPNFDPYMGETMAETYARKTGSVRHLTSDIMYDDEWTDPATSSSASFSYAYTDLMTPTPISKASCLKKWEAYCRIVINYEAHIHPLWSVERVNNNVDITCTACHTNTDDMGDFIVPAKQLDLSDGPSSDESDHYKSYRELLFNDNEVELQEGVLVDRMIDTGNVNDVPQVDNDGNPVLDENGDQIVIQVPIFEPVPVRASMSTNGALSSARFISLFKTGGTHENYLSGAELKLIYEWLDIGAQYFNDPFLAPEN